MTATRFWAVPVLTGLLGCVGLALPPGERATREEMDGFRSLHHATVQHFIGRNGFGANRMVPDLSDILNAPASASDTAATPRRPAQQPRDPQAIKKGAEAKDAHFPLAKLVAGWSYLPAPAENKQWVVKDVHLIGLVKHPDPVVYLAGGAADGGMTEEKKEQKEKTRKPDAFEAKGLEVIQGGGGLHAERRDAGFRAVAGIYAGKQCAACHERNGELLGAFSYRLAIETAPAGSAVP